MTNNRSQNGPVVLLAAALLAAVLGSVHAFSVFLVPLEVQFGESRARISLTYSLALLALTAAVLTGPRLFARWSASRFVLMTGLGGALGLLIAALADALPTLWLGYGLIFGAANGLGYGFGLQIAAQALPGREGLAMGTVTAAYALGAAVSPALFSYAVLQGGFATAMIGLTAVLVVVSVASAALMHRARASFLAENDPSARLAVPLTSIALLWIGYGAGVAGGLMAIGHAAGIAATFGHMGGAWAAPALIAVCNLSGSLIAGRMADRVPVLGLLVALPLASALAVLVLAWRGSPGLVMICLGFVGFAYGGIIAAYPTAISKLYGMAQSPRIYGRVFTAWGCAGLFAPWFAGALFDSGGSYRRALLSAGALGVVSAGAMAVFALRGRAAPT